jgi:hypothetical protein
MAKMTAHGWRELGPLLLSEYTGECLATECTNEAWNFKGDSTVNLRVAM